MKETIIAAAIIILFVVFGIITIRILFKDAPEFEDNSDEGLSDKEKEIYHQEKAKEKINQDVIFNEYLN